MTTKVTGHMTTGVLTLDEEQVLTPEEQNAVRQKIGVPGPISEIDLMLLPEDDE